MNSELRSDFISEFSRAAVQPINEFQTDIQRSIPSSVGTNMATPSVRVDVRPGAYLPQKPAQTLPNRVTKMIADIDREKNIFIEIGDFAQYLTTELQAPEFAQASTDLQR